MTNGRYACPIWALDCRFTGYLDDDGATIWRVENSFRAGGDYEITREARDDAGNLNDDEKARLTSILVEQWMKGIAVPRLTIDDVQRAKDRQPLPKHERADRLLRLLASRSPRAGAVLEIAPYAMFLSFADQLSASGVPVGTNIEFNPEFYLCPSALAWSESTTDEELDFLTDYLMGQNCISKGSRITSNVGTTYAGNGYLCRVEVPGYGRIEELVTNPDSSQCFVAMWFDDSMNEVYENGIRPGIEDAGYKPLIINQMPDLIGKIEDEIIAEIRRSKFMVADFTHGDDGVRGSVYYEAGFAHALRLKVIFTRRKSKEGVVHFDTDHYYRIEWETPEDLRKQLKVKIEAAIGEGPLKSHRG